MWQRMADRRAARQAETLKRFWQTHPGITWQVGLTTPAHLSDSSLTLLPFVSATDG